MITILRDAGWPIWGLLATSILALTLIIERLLCLRTSRVAPAGLAEQVQAMLRNGQDSAEAVDRLGLNSPLGFILAEVLRHRHLPHDAQRLAVEDAGRMVTHLLERNISAIGTIAIIAPLMGLFGTVVGMIHIFGSYTVAGDDPALLARGISIALYNTGFGILVAIPAMIFHRYLRRRVDSLVLELEAAASRLTRTLAAYPDTRRRVA